MYTDLVGLHLSGYASFSDRSLNSGINFPCYAFENQADTEGFAAMANRAGYQVVGLPNYIVWHIDTEEKEGNLKGRPKEEAQDS